MKIIHGLVILVILGGVFYWFQWRPSEIRKECSGEVVPLLYQQCLHERGLEE